MNGITIIDDKNIADVKIEIVSNSLEELFDRCLAAFNLILIDKEPKTRPKKINLKINGKNLDQIVFNFFEQLIFLKDVNHWLIKKAKIKERLKNQIVFEMEYQKIDRQTVIKGDIKALTHHQFQVKKIGKRYLVILVFDL